MYEKDFPDPSRLILELNFLQIIRKLTNNLPNNYLNDVIFLNYIVRLCIKSVDHTNHYV